MKWNIYLQLDTIYICKRCISNTCVINNSWRVSAYIVVVQKIAQYLASYHSVNYINGDPEY